MSSSKFSACCVLTLQTAYERRSKQRTAVLYIQRIINGRLNASWKICSLVICARLWDFLSWRCHYERDWSVNHLTGPLIPFLSFDRLSLMLRYYQKRFRKIKRLWDYEFEDREFTFLSLLLLSSTTTSTRREIQLMAKIIDWFPKTNTSRRCW